MGGADASGAAGRADGRQRAYRRVENRGGRHLAQSLRAVWNPDIGSFTQAYGSTCLESAVLVMPTISFIDARDPRMLSTIEAITSRLKAGPYPLLYRYLADDGVGGAEGAFLLPSFWLVEARAQAGDLRRARATLSALLQHMSPTGLYSEEIHPGNGMLLGDFPQGFSHLGLINAIFRLEEIKRAAEVHEEARGWEIEPL
jgi:alpha,alpha-trehalase